MPGGVGGGGDLRLSFQRLMPSPIFAKIPNFLYGGGSVIFYADSKSAKISNFLYGRRRLVFVETSAEKLR